MKEQTIYVIEKYSTALLFILVPCSCLFTEFFSTNIYVVNGYLTFLLIFFTLFNIRRNTILEITNLELMLFLIICFSLLSAIIKSQQIQTNIYMSLLLYWFVLFQAKSSIKKNKFSEYIYYTIVFINILTLLLLTISYLKFGEYKPYIEKHFGNTGIYAILLAISVTLMFYRIISLRKKYLFPLFLIIFFNIILIIDLQSRLAILLIIIFIVIILFSFLRFPFLKPFKTILIIFVCFFVSCILAFNFKTDSTQGRWFILQISTDIIKDNPFIGSGGFNTFSLNYPLFQAKYFSTGLATEKEILLADNTKYLFNEFIQILIENGFLSFILVLFVCWKSYKILKKENFIIQIFAMSLFTASLFYYIYHITIFQTLLFLMFAYLASKDKVYFRINLIGSKILSFIILLICLSTAYETYIKIVYSLELETLFYKNQPFIAKGNIIEGKFRDNPIVLGLYAYELHQKKRYIESLTILNSVEDIYIHSDLINLKGKILFKLGNMQLAELYFIKATQICPNRFIYKHDLFKYYLNINNHPKAKEIARQIVDLTEKIQTPTTLAIKQEAERYLVSNSEIN